MTRGDIKAEVARRLAEPTGGTFFSTADIEAAIDLGYAELSDATEWYENWVDIALLKDQWYYDLRSVVGESFLAIRPVFDKQTNRWLIPSTVRQLDTHDRRWERVTGEPQRVFLRGLWWLGFYPRIQSEIGSIKAYYAGLPPAFTSDDDVPGFPGSYHYGLVEFALTDLWAQDGETTLALASWTAYLAVEAGLTSWVDERAGGPMSHGFDGANASVQR